MKIHHVANSSLDESVIITDLNGNKYSNSFIFKSVLLTIYVVVTKTHFLSTFSTRSQLSMTIPLMLVTVSESENQSETRISLLE